MSVTTRLLTGGLAALVSVAAFAAAAHAQSNHGDLLLE